jgi:putative hemolysin
VLIIFAVIAILILVNGFYVAAEFSTVSAKRSRLAQHADEGHGHAAAVLKVVESPARLDTYIAACQLGITVSSLMLGYYGQAQVMGLLGPYVDQISPTFQVLLRSIATTMVLVVLTVSQVILGELMPKNVGLQYPERIAILTAPAMHWSVSLFRPLIWLFNGSGSLILRLIGAAPPSGHAHVHLPQEILMLVEESSAGGKLDAGERRLLVNTLQLRNLTARKVMIPRNHMLAAPADEEIETLFSLLAASPYSRLVLYEETIDSIVGIVHLKDLLTALYPVATPEGSETHHLPKTRAIMSPLLYVPDSAEVGDVMNLMQRERQNLVIVVDEYGGTAGMITFEDLVEEIIGEFQDEFDEENPPIELRPNQRVRVRGDVLVEDLNNALSLALPKDDVSTIGGLVLATLGRIPNVGETIELGQVTVRVDKTYQNGVAAISFPITPQQAEQLRVLEEEI